MPSPYRNAAYRKAARAAALRRVAAEEEERTPERIKEDLDAARRRVEELERELADAKKEEEPEEESVEARLRPRAIYARMNGRKGGRA